MASSLRLRSARRRFRDSVAKLIAEGDGNTSRLNELADQFFTNEVLFFDIWKAFIKSESAKATARLRDEGAAETTGRMWKPVDQLVPSDVDVIIDRRIKHQLGEANSLVKFCHKYGRTDVAVAAATAAHLLDKFEDQSPVEERSPVEEPAAVNR